MTDPGDRNRGFTMVELVVVVGIIAILMAMLLPSLTIARMQASRAKCLNNVRQIGLGIAVYVHDNKDLPPAEPLPQYLPLKVYAPVFYAERKAGLLALKQSSGFDRFYLSCPSGWASGGDRSYYEGKGLSSTGSAYMDYAYWGGRYPTGKEYDVRAASFTYRIQEKGTKILVTDIVAEQGGGHAEVLRMVKTGNHPANHSGPAQMVQMTDGQGNLLPTKNLMRSTGASVLFSDFHAVWFPASKLTQQTSGLCYPPPDQWR
ncbi:MAG: type II secretion system protein [Bacillota bacterium]